MGSHEAEDPNAKTKITWVTVYDQKELSVPHKFPVPRSFRKGSKGSKGSDQLPTRDGALSWLSSALGRPVTAIYVQQKSGSRWTLERVENPSKDSFPDGSILVTCHDNQPFDDEAVSARLPLLSKDEASAAILFARSTISTLKDVLSSGSTRRKAERDAIRSQVVEAARALDLARVHVSESSEPLTEDTLEDGLSRLESTLSMQQGLVLDLEDEDVINSVDLVSFDRKVSEGACKDSLVEAISTRLAALAHLVADREEPQSPLSARLAALGRRHAKETLAQVQQVQIPLLETGAESSSELPSLDYGVVPVLQGAKRGEDTHPPVKSEDSVVLNGQKPTAGTSSTSEKETQKSCCILL
eukprot:TRINITY_DN15941_c0_g1_i1.p1 TRINITY_DN15941_c0_g1~~TRINITY_DN15941_c0_g1_i1.p1  ORF type:complete len:357 (-),score=71.14 TRINITY_DN15941_c0_g1_i1:56-1126(-)